MGKGKKRLVAVWRDDGQLCSQKQPDLGVFAFVDTPVNNACIDQCCLEPGSPVKIVLL